MKKLLFSLFALLAFNTISNAQVSSLPFTQSLDTYQPIIGTVIDAPNEDDFFHSNLPIGFPFTLNGNTFTKFGICTNGFIALDSISNTSMWMLNSNHKNFICAMMGDLRNTNTGGSIEYVTIGTAPNRMLVIQWKDYGVFGLLYSHLNFQIRLHETTNCIQFVYGLNGLSGNNARTFLVGVKGNTPTDYNFRKTPQDWINTVNVPNFPTSTDGNMLNALSVLPNGLVYSFGSCPATGTPFSYLTGQVYNDANNNGLKDVGELGMPNIVIHETTQNYNTLTDANGNYAMFFTDSTVSYTLSSTPLNYWNVSSTPTTYTIVPTTQATANRDFGHYPTPNVHDVEITSTYNNVPWPNATVNVIATYHNNGTVVEMGDTITFVKDSNYAFVNSNPAPTFVNGNTIGWTYSNLLINEYRNIQLTLHADTTITLGDTLHSSWKIQPLVGDANIANNTYVLNQACLSSFDPNSKSVSPDGNIDNSQVLEYTIHFQNTGTFQALNVFLYDTLDSNLDVSTFKLLGSSHSVTNTLNGTGNLKFTFANILLPDSNSIEPASHGFVTYSIKPKQGLAVGTKLHNTASIVFDFNAPVVTNTTENIIYLNTPESVSQISSNYNGVIVYPNPIKNELSITAKNPFFNVDVRVYDLFGKMIIANEKLNGNLLKIDVSSLTKGIYILELNENNQLRKVKIVKE